MEAGMMIAQRNAWTSLLATFPLLLVATTLIAQPPSERPDHEHRAKAEVKYVSQSALGKGVTHAQLSNGMNVLVQENHAAPVATVRPS